jgi:putative SOS response-associated peptidase YedK
MEGSCRWRDHSAIEPTGSQDRPIPTFTVVTTVRNRWMARIHNRMPVILRDDQLDGRLNSTTEAGTLSEILKPCPEFLEFYPVEAKLVNSGRIDAP